MGPSAVKAVRVSSSGASGKAWATVAVATRTVPSTNTIATGASFAGFRNACLSA